MLRAIRALAGDGPVQAPPTAVAQRKTQDAAERRQLAVMFCDLVGSTALAAQLDPEDMADLIRAFRDATGQSRASTVMSLDRWGTARWSISVIPAPMRTTPSARRAPVLGS